MPFPVMAVSRFSAQHQKDRRKHVRYPVGARVSFTWRIRGTPFRAEGTAQDISLRGAYVVSEVCPPLGAIVQMKIFLPRPSPTAPGLLIVGKLRMQRVESSLGGKRRMGFSVVGKGFAVSTNAQPRLTIVKPQASHKSYTIAERAPLTLWDGET
jgi:PilZ domain